MVEVKITESYDYKEKNPMVILGFPEVGLVGLISSMYLVDSLKLSEIGFVESDVLPPVIAVHKKKPLDPVRIYSNGPVIALLSEIPVPVEAIYPISMSIVDWLEKKNPEIVIMLGGFPVQNREQIETPKVTGAASNERSMKILTAKKVDILEEGFIIGTYGLVLKECSRRNIPAVYLMAESHYGIPDPEAAVSIVNALNKIFDMKIDVKSLIKQGEELRVKTRDLMRRTQESMKEVQKIQEQELPAMYG